MDQYIKKKLAKNWFKTLQEVLCREIEEKEGKKTKFKITNWNRSKSNDEGGGQYDGWFCPCHGSHYDTSGRIRKGPAPTNMEIPKYEFVNTNTIKIG